MTSKKPSDLWSDWSDQDLPTTAEDVQALRKHRPSAGGDWLADLTALAAQAPEAAIALRRRRTFAGLPPFEL
jgi:hypothetical protein